MIVIGSSVIDSKQLSRMATQLCLYPPYMVGESNFVFANQHKWMLESIWSYIIFGSNLYWMHWSCTFSNFRCLNWSLLGKNDDDVNVIQKWGWCWFLYLHIEIRIPYCKMGTKGPYISTNLYILLSGGLWQRNWKHYVCIWLFQKEIFYFQEESSSFFSFEIFE